MNTTINYNGIFKNYFLKLPFNKELIVLLLIILVLGMMTIPLPPELMDGVIALNLGVTMILLMVVVYIKSPLKISSFPSILLVLALLRIGITVSTSRLILLDGNAGEIIQTFGNFVAGGNLIVGIIIFAIITIINFIVITKGSERVAEVAARFSLDAMPGKQMSIDSDLRAGNITMEDAKIMRQELMLESKLYGAMDGAMKLVKGDAIASIIDILINLCGGIGIGMGQHGLDFSSAIHTYSILTIGDGLVQQIPALIVSLSAGILITYVQNDLGGAPSSVAGNLILQLFSDYRALFSAAIMLVLMSLIPGMPSAILIFLAILVSVLAMILFQKHKVAHRKKSANSGNIIEDGDVNIASTNSLPANANQWQIIPLMLNLSEGMKDSEIATSIKQILATVKNDLFLDLGVNIPQIIVRYSNQLENNSYQIMVNEIPADTVTIPNNRILLLENSNAVFNVLKLSKEQIVENNINYGLPTKGVWINNNLLNSCSELKLQYLTVNQVLTTHVKFVLNKFASKFLGLQEVKNILDKMTDLQELIRELLRMIPLNTFTDILQRLIHEGISIRDFKTILDTTLEYAQEEKEPYLITEEVRRTLGRYIAYKFSNGKFIIPCFLLTQELEDLIRDAIRYNGKGSYLALDSTVTQSIIQEVKSKYEELQCAKLAIPLAIVTHIDIRRYVRSMIESQLPYISVLSLQEIDKHAEYNILTVLDMPALDNTNENDDFDDDD